MLGGLEESNEHLDDLFEGGGVYLDECCRVQVGGVGSSDGFELLRLVLWGSGSGVC